MYTNSLLPHASTSWFLYGKKDQLLLFKTAKYRGAQNCALDLKRFFLKQLQIKKLRPKYIRIIFIAVFVAGSGSNELFISRRDLFNLMRSSEREKFEDQCTFLKEHLKIRTRCPEDELNELYRKISHFTFRLKEKWIQASRKESSFIDKNKESNNIHKILKCSSTFCQ